MIYISSPFPLLPSVLSWESQESVLKSVLSDSSHQHAVCICPRALSWDLLRAVLSLLPSGQQTQDTHFIACGTGQNKAPRMHISETGMISWDLDDLTVEKVVLSSLKWPRWPAWAADCVDPCVRWHAEAAAKKLAKYRPFLLFSPGLRSVVWPFSCPPVSYLIQILDAEWANIIGLQWGMHEQWPLITGQCPIARLSLGQFMWWTGEGAAMDFKEFSL